MKYKHFIIAILFALLPAQLLKAETFQAGSYIVDMGVLPQTYNNGLLPYGMVYDMVIEQEVPLYWIINPGKRLFDTDFTYHGTDSFTVDGTKSYSAGSFVLPAIYVTDEVKDAIAYWIDKGVKIDGPVLREFDAPVYNYISSFPNAIVDKANFKLTFGMFYSHTAIYDAKLPKEAKKPEDVPGVLAGIPTSYYSMGTPADIDACCDVYALPHADPQKWNDDYITKYKAYTDGKAQSFLWQGCHSVGAVEAHDPFLEMFILTTNGQVSWKDDPNYKFENKNTPPYLYERSAGAHPIMQIAAPLDDSSMQESFSIEGDFDVHVQSQDGFVIEQGSDPVVIRSDVVIECRYFELGEGCTIDIQSGGSLTILINGDAKFMKNSSITTYEGPEQFLLMSEGNVLLGDDAGTENYNGFFYSKDGLQINKDTNITGAVTSVDTITLGDATSTVDYNATFATPVNTQVKANGWTTVDLFPQATYIIDSADKPNYTIDIGNGSDGAAVVPIEITKDMYYSSVVVTGTGSENAKSALQDGSQEIYIPRPDSAWRPETTVAIWDPDNVNLSLNGGNPNKAALIAFGRAYGDPQNGVLVQHTSHTAATGTEAQNVSSARFYGNLLLQASIEKRPIVTIHAANEMSYGNDYNMSATVERGSAPFDFNWTIACPLQESEEEEGYLSPGVFVPPSETDVNISRVIFTPNNNTLTNCILRVKVTDFCGRKNFATKILGIAGYHPPLGYYNITHEGAVFPNNEDTLVTEDPVNSLYTQISDKPFNVKLVALQSDKVTLDTTKTGNVILELIETAGVTILEPKTCAEASVVQEIEGDVTGKITPSANGSHFNNSATVNATDISYPYAKHDIGFRISYYDLPLKDANDYYEFGIPKSLKKRDQHKRFPGCSTKCTADSPQSWECYKCIARSALVGGYGKAVCARDNFSIRPASFDLDLSGTAPFIGGREYDLQFNAVTADGTIDREYTESFSDVGLLFAPTSEANITAALSTPIPSGCDTSSVTSPALSNSNITFESGVGSIDDDDLFVQTPISFKYDNVGKIDITAVEDKWSNPDKDKAYTTDNGVSMIYSDCIEGSASNTPVNGKVGCMIMGLESNITFIPGQFINTLSLRNFNNGTFTYVANSEGSDPEYGAKINLTYTAVLDDGATTATNYTVGCYANDIVSTITLLNNKVLGWEGTKGRAWMYDNNTSTTPKLINSQNTVPPLFTYAYPETHFNAGVASEKVLFNFDRKINTPDNPFKIEYKDFDITNVHDTVNTSVIGSDFNRTNGNPNESDATFYYARAKASQSFYNDIASGSVNTPISVAVYCNKYPTCSEFSSNIQNSGKINEPYWWLSLGHNADNQDGNITLEVGTITPAGTASITPDAVVRVVSQGQDTDVNVQHNSGGVPMMVEIDLDDTAADTSPWLIYNPNAASTPSPFYRVRFIGVMDWAGHGDTGHVVDTDTSTKKNRKLGW